MTKEICNPDIKRIMDSIDVLRCKIKMISLGSIYIPNTKQHQELWALDKQIIDNAFIPFIDESIIREIIEIDVMDSMKMLLLLGIGIFNVFDTNIAYMEIMKRSQSSYLLCGVLKFDCMFVRDRTIEKKLTRIK